MHHLPLGTVTLLFTDIEGSTRLLQQLGERYAPLLTEYRQLLGRAFEEYHGHEVDTQGDACLVAFARATDAVAAAVTVQRALAAHSWPQGGAVRVRMGLHTGEPELAPTGYVGLDVHRAARIMSVGHGGQVLLSQTTRDLVEHDMPTGVSLRDLGAHRLKDLQHPSHLFQLVIADLAADFPPLRTLDTRPNNLPVQLTPLIGRAKEVALVQNLLHHEDIRLLTLTGPGGIGKTRMALQVAAELSDRFADGIFFVNLAPISDPTFVMPTVAQALGLKETGDQPLLDLLKTSLRDKQLLLLLDNFEQIVSAAVQVAELLAASPKLKVVVTSRAVLHVRGEQEFAVPPLAVPDPNHSLDLVALAQYEAVALFIARAHAVKLEFQVTNANARAIAEICVRLDGLPLAIELAAARLKLLPPQALLARLGQRLALLTSASRDVPTRQQTLRNTIAWSYHLLDVAEQRLFQRLSLFVGGCTLKAIEAVSAALDKDSAGQVLDGVASLIDKSLLRQMEEEGEESRLVMLETIREYGMEAFAASGEMEAAQRAYATYYLVFAEEAEPKLFGEGQGMWLGRLEQEHENLRTALRWLLERKENEMSLRLCAALWRYWVIRGHLSEGRNFFELALKGSEEVPASVRAKALKAAGRVALALSDYDQGEALCQESLELFRELGDTTGIAHSLYRLGRIAQQRHDYGRVRSLIEEALALFREVDDKEHMAWSLLQLADVALHQDESVRVLSLAEEALALFREVGDKTGIATALGFTAHVTFSRGNHVRAGTLVEKSLMLCREVGYKWGIADGLHLLGQVLLRQGDTSRAQLLAEEALAHFKEIGDRQGIAKLLSFLAKVIAFQGDYPVARTLYEESLSLARELNDTWIISSCLEGLASVIAAQGEPMLATRLWGAAEALAGTIGAPIPPVERIDYESSVAVARTQLGEKVFVAAWAEGRTMTPEQALAAQGPMTIPEESSGTLRPTKAKTPPTYPAGLTAREVEVLRLVAQGLTDAQVAAQLVVSPRTINFHLTSIYAKIGVSSRSAATRYAIEQHLI